MNAHKTNMSNIQVAFDSPIYCMNLFSCPSFLSESVRSSPQFILCGGGGKGRTGITNFIAIGSFCRNEDGTLYFKSLANCKTGSDLVSQVVSSSNGQCVFGSLQNGTVIYRVVEGGEEQPLALEKVLFQEMDTTKSGTQNVLVAKKDDSTLFTGGNDGTLRIHRFEPKEDADQEKQLKSLHAIHLFDFPITAITLNPTENFCVVGSEKGEIAIIELSSMGVIQRIRPNIPKAKVRTLIFSSATVLLALVNQGRTHSHVLFLSPKTVDSSAQWEVTRTVTIRSVPLSCMHFDARSNTVCAGTNSGGVRVFEYPSFRDYMKEQITHGLPVTSVACIPPTASLLRNAETEGEEDGWVLSSSIDYTVSVLRCKKTASSLPLNGLLLLFFGLIALLFACLLFKN